MSWLEVWSGGTHLQAHGGLQGWRGGNYKRGQPGWVTGDKHREADHITEKSQGHPDCAHRVCVHTIIPAIRRARRQPAKTPCKKRLHVINIHPLVRHKQHILDEQ